MMKTRICWSEIYDNGLYYLTGTRDDGVAVQIAYNARSGVKLRVLEPGETEWTSWVYEVSGFEYNGRINKVPTLKKKIREYFKMYY